MLIFNFSLFIFLWPLINFVNKIITDKENSMGEKQLEKRLELLEQYAETLERENFAKNNETALLYQQISSIQEENNMLKSCIDAMKQREMDIAQKQREQQELLNKIQVSSSRNFQQQLRSSIDMNAMKIVADDIRMQLTRKQDQISELQSENRMLKSDIAKFKEEMGKMAERVVKSEEKLRKKCEQIKKIEEQSFNGKNSRFESKGISFARLQVDKLVKQNNQLIQRIRNLEKEKNNYFSELKMASPLKSRSPNTKGFLEISRKKSQKQDRWNVMEDKIKAIRDENEQLKANLAIE